MLRCYNQLHKTARRDIINSQFSQSFSVSLALLDFRKFIQELNSGGSKASLVVWHHKSLILLSHIYNSQRQIFLSDTLIYLDIKFSALGKIKQQNNTQKNSKNKIYIQKNFLDLSSIESHDHCLSEMTSSSLESKSSHFLLPSLSLENSC